LSKHEQVLIVPYLIGKKLEDKTYVLTNGKTIGKGSKAP
jgi:hypothetical protein